MKIKRWIKIYLCLMIFAITLMCSVLYSSKVNVALIMDEIKKERELNAKEIHDFKATPQQWMAFIKEMKWRETASQIPPLTRSGGKGVAGGYTFTYYSSRVLYHYRTPEWRLDNQGCYRAWNGSEWCYVVSMNSGYGFMGQTLHFDFGPVIVLDSGCAEGKVDMYVNW